MIYQKPSFLFKNPNSMPKTTFFIIGFVLPQCQWFELGLLNKETNNTKLKTAHIICELQQDHVLSVKLQLNHKFG